MKRTELLPYMQRLSAFIGQALKREGLGGTLIRAKQGPLTLNYTIMLQDPNLANVKKALNIAPALRQLTRLKQVRVSEGGLGIDVEFPSPVPHHPNMVNYLDHMRGANVVVGIDKWAEPAYLNLKENPNVLFVGPPGRGKSTAVKSILFAVLATNKKGVRFAIFSAKRADWEPFATVQGCVGLFSNPEQIDAEMQRISDGMNAGQADPTPTFIILDDFQNLLGQCKSLTTSLSTVVSMGRAFRRYVFCLTQTTGSKDTSGGFKIEDLFDARVVYRTASNHSAARATGASAAAISELTDEKGDGVLVQGGHITRIATLYVNNQALLDLPQAKQPLAPFRPTVTPIDAPPRPTLPRIEPPRVLTEEEAVRVELYIRSALRNRVPLSKNKLVVGLYGVRTPKTIRLTEQSLDADVLDLVKQEFGGKSG